MAPKKISTFLVVLLSVFSSFAQEKFTLSGTIIDANSNETLIGVNVVIPEVKTGVTTNEYGFYSITLPKGIYSVQISYLGYQNIEESINLNQNTKNNFNLYSNETALKEVVITGNKTKIDIKKPEMSVNKLSISAIKKMPVVLGEVDVLKSILLLPGVTNAGEGASGFNVRGGGADQNLILLDEATIFNSSHVFGFFSVFNPDAIKDLKLYKGGIPARYGGRASSVLDIYQKDGNSKSFHLNGGIGLISSRILAEGPLVKNKGSFLIGGRSSYAHLFLKLSEEQKNNSAYFYDLNTKLSYKLDSNNSVYLSGYFGRDVFSLNKSFSNIFGNSTLNLRWNHLFSEKLFSNLSLIYSDYYYGLDLDFIGFQWDSGIKNYNIKYDFKNYISDKFKLNYGLNGIYYEFNPGTIKPSNLESGINFDPNDPRKKGVLQRWYKAVSPLLKSYYGTGGDLNVDEIHEVIPMTEECGVWHPQEGVFNGHFKPTEADKINRIGQLRQGVVKVIENPKFSPDVSRKYTVADMITGYGVAEAVRHYYTIYGGDVKGKKAIVQGFGNVGSAAAFYLAEMGAKIIGILDRDGGLINEDGFTFEEMRTLFLAKDGNKLVAKNMIPFEEINQKIWAIGAEIFTPCAASRLVTQSQIDSLITNGLEVISCGANVPFADKEIFFGPIMEDVDHKVSLIPDFISNCGMARVFAYFMEKKVELTDEAVFHDTSEIIKNAIEKAHAISSSKTNISATAFEIALKQLV